MDALDNTQRQRLQKNPGHTKQKDNNKITAAEESKQELIDAIDESNDVVASATTALNLFPDTVAVDRAKVTIAKRKFFGMAEVTSIRLEDILNVEASLGPVFGTVKIISRVMNNETPSSAGLFWRKDALMLKRIIQGFELAYKKKIDCSTLGSKELKNLLLKLGEDDHTL